MPDSEPETYSDSWAIQNRRHTQSHIKHLTTVIILHVLIIFAISDREF